MPSGALNEYDCKDDEANKNQMHFATPGVETCWHQRDFRLENPVCCSDQSDAANNLTKPNQHQDNDSGQIAAHLNDVARIREGFNAWLAVFRKSRPQRDVIWRLGKI